MYLVLQTATSEVTSASGYKDLCLISFDYMGLYNHLSILNAREAHLLMWSRVSSRLLGGKAQLLGDGQ